MLVRANAKINWCLDVLGQREDGYHLLDMLMQPVTLHDDVTLELDDTISLTCSGSPLIPPDENHLALRAARLLAAETGCTMGVKMHVFKRIPAGAGMGGGSADAAAVLFGLNKLWELDLSQEKLEAIGLKLGADVPFCLRGGLQRTTGIGETMVSCGKPPIIPLVVIQPCEGLSTGKVFQAWHQETSPVHVDTDAVADVLVNGTTRQLKKLLKNSLQPVSQQMRPEIREAIDALMGAGADAALMTGSGSAVFGVFASHMVSRQVQRELSKKWKRCWECLTCAQSCSIE